MLSGHCGCLLVNSHGRLSKDEFVIAMFLTERAKQGIPLPSSLPPHLKPATTTGSSSPGGSSFEDRRRAHFEQGRLELERRRRELQEQADREKVRRCRDGTKPGLWTHGLDRGLDYGLDRGPKIDSILGM